MRLTDICFVWVADVKISDIWTLKKIPDIRLKWTEFHVSTFQKLTICITLAGPKPI